MPFSKHGQNAMGNYERGRKILPMYQYIGGKKSQFYDTKICLPTLYLTW